MKKRIFIITLIHIFLLNSNLIDAAAKAKPDASENQPMIVEPIEENPLEETNKQIIPLPVSIENPNIINESKIETELIKKIESEPTDPDTILKEITVEAQTIPQASKNEPLEQGALAKFIGKAKGFTSDLLNKIKNNKLLSGVSAGSAAIIGLLLIKLGASRTESKKLLENSKLKEELYKKQTASLQAQLNKLKDSEDYIKGEAERNESDAIFYAKQYIKNQGLTKEQLDNKFKEFQANPMKRTGRDFVIYKILENQKNREALASKKAGSAAN